MFVCLLNLCNQIQNVEPLYWKQISLLLIWTSIYVYIYICIFIENIAENLNCVSDVCNINKNKSTWFFQLALILLHPVSV